MQFLARFSEFFFAVFWNFHYLGNKRTVKSDSMASPNDLPTFFVWYSIIYLVGYRRSKNCMKATPFLNHIVIKILNLILSTIYLVVDAKFENFYNGSGGKVMIIGEFHPSNWKPWNLPLPSWPCQIRNENLDAFCLLKVVKNCKNEIIICNSFTKQNQIEKSWIVCDPLWVCFQYGELAATWELERNWLVP